MKLKKALTTTSSQQLPAQNEPSQQHPSGPDTENEDQTQIGSVLGFETFLWEDWWASCFDVFPDLNDGSCVSLKHVGASH